MVKQISDNEIYFLIKYIKRVVWSVAKCLSYIEEARCLKVKHTAVKLLGAILSLKGKRQIRSATKLSSHMLSSECEVCYNLSTVRIIGSLCIQTQANFIFFTLCKHLKMRNSGTL